MKFKRTRLSASFHRLSLAAKTRLLFTALAGIALLLAISAWSGLVWLNGKTRHYGETAQTALMGSQLAGSFARAQSHAQHYAASGDASELSQAQDELAATHKIIADLNSQTVASHIGVTARLEGLDQAVTAFGTLISALPPSVTDEGRAAIAGRLDRVTLGGSDFFVQAGSMNEEIDQSLEATGQSALRGLAWFIGVISVLGTGASLAAVFAVRFARANISAPIERITSAMSEIVAGNVALTIPEGGRSDEIGEMARALAVFKDRSEQVERLQANAAEAARGEAQLLAEQQQMQSRLRAEHDRHLAELARMFEASVGDVVSSVASASLQLQRTSAAMAVAAEQTAEQTDQVSRSLHEASQGVTAAAAAGDEFAMSISEISQQAATSAELARAVSGNAAQADAAISSLSASASEIGTVVQLIADIAQRTDLLALNASLEAARAGDAGRGFAVVASEVKELARRIGFATEEIDRQIQGMQESTGQSIDVLRAIGSQIGLLEQAAVSIATAVDQQSTAGRDLAQSIDLAARNSDEIAAHIGDVRNTAEATGAAASEVLFSSNELEHQSAMLKQKAETFLHSMRNTELSASRVVNACDDLRAPVHC